VLPTCWMSTAISPRQLLIFSASAQYRTDHSVRCRTILTTPRFSPIFTFVFIHRNHPLMWCCLNSVSPRFYSIPMKIGIQSVLYCFWIQTLVGMRIEYSYEALETPTLVSRRPVCFNPIPKSDSAWIPSISAFYRGVSLGENSGLKIL